MTPEFITDDMRNDAKVLLSYMKMQMPVSPADVIVGMGSSDVRTARHAARLYKQGLAPLVVFTGGRGKLTEKQTLTEAEVFRNEAVSLGVPTEAILLESKSTNTGENVRYLYELLIPYKPKRLLIACKIYNERRVYATFAKQWPDNETAITVSSPDMNYEDYPNDQISESVFINLMVGDVWRINTYVAAGYQIPQSVPEQVTNAMQRLNAAGFNTYTES